MMLKLATDIFEHYGIIMKGHQAKRNKQFWTKH